MSVSFNAGADAFPSLTRCQKRGAAIFNLTAGFCGLEVAVVLVKQAAKINQWFCSSGIIFGSNLLIAGAICCAFSVAIKSIRNVINYIDKDEINQNSNFRLLQDLVWGASFFCTQYLF